MDFYERSQLPVLAFETEPDALDRNEIRRALCEKPCNIVFVETKGKLSGIVSRGDISRARDAGFERVPVNKSFSVYCGQNLIAARDIFLNKERVNEIPVTDEAGRLLGMLSRSDDLLYLKYSSPWEENRYIGAFLKHLQKALFVRPDEADGRRMEIFDRWIREFERAGVLCEQIDFTDIPERQIEDVPILLVDEEMHNGAAALIESLDHGVFRLDQVHTFRAYERIMSEHAYDELISKLSDSGIRIYNMYYTEDENTPARKRLFEGMRNWRKMPGARDVNPHVIPSCAEGFYGELNVGDYAARVGKLYFHLESSSVYARMKDTKSRYLNITDGERLTIGQPKEAEHTIWFFGPCFILGGFVEDRYTIESLLQEELNREGYSFKVVNYGCYESLYQRMVHIASTSMKPGDILVMHLENRPYEGTCNIDLMDLLDRENVPAAWLLDKPTHCNHKVNRIYAEALFAQMLRDGALIDRNESGNKSGAERGEEACPVLLSLDLAIKSLYLDLHFSNYQPKAGEVVGSVSMHANPFTLGHRYLIETAAGRVDFLFVFLLEDETGLASFAERLAMAVEGTRDLPNVQVVPSGPFQGSRNIFREYFVAAEPADMQKGAASTTRIFSEIIAPRLGITKRFLGEENTRKMQYFNRRMKEIMPENGIEVIEIPRKKADGRPISAAAVRSAARKGDIKTLRASLPETSLPYFIGP